MGSVCSHVAALLFKLHACTQLELNKVACTSKLCSWKKSRKQAHPAPLKCLSFKRHHQKDLLPKTDSPFKGSLIGFSTPDPIKFATKTHVENIKALKKIAPDAVVFSSISQYDDERSTDESSTDTAEENDCTSLPELLTSFFVPSAINETTTKIKEYGEKLYSQYLNSCTQFQFKNLTKLTFSQSLNEKWMLHRVGRITASNCKAAYTMNLENPSISTINQIMQYNEEIKTAPVFYGKKMESTARQAYILQVKELHTNFVVTNTGLHVNQNFPYLGASPDGLIECSCHGKGVLEIKCPFKYQSGLTNWINDKNCPITEEGEMKTTHPYYFQIHMQMLVTERNYCDFFVWTKGKHENDTRLVRVSKDLLFIENLKLKLENTFQNVILPELVCRKQDPHNEKEHQLYCYCKRPSFPPMIACDGLTCKIEWFHYSCVNLTHTPSPNSTWYCPNCIVSRTKKKKTK